MTSLGSGSTYNRVTVSLVVADKAAVRKILEAVGDANIVRITGSATILKGS